MRSDDSRVRSDEGNAPGSPFQPSPTRIIRHSARFLGVCMAHFPQMIPSFARQIPPFTRTSPCFPRQNPAFIRTSPSFARKIPPFIRTNPCFPRTSPRFIRTSPRFIRTRPRRILINPRSLWTSIPVFRKTGEGKAKAPDSPRRIFLSSPTETPGRRQPKHRKTIFLNLPKSSPQPVKQCFSGSVSR